ncbi:hypothetical protein SISSUDRAFT_1045937 [Sistotremastrum suecicum HHB10207 ss-3]|uniref:Uncharacterized protein n=1 Tax=Sistotremastrum suecicum HHB10207 ss-3 TaxID=1314776 RepID=A0A166E3U2_9AGAM|nr:hypothetical protein SISSUDRAFT_1045937 [Sistotremastrum suecicum HHB10207 ss-3]
MVAALRHCKPLATDPPNTYSLRYALFLASVREWKAGGYTDNDFITDTLDTEVQSSTFECCLMWSEDLRTDEADVDDVIPALLKGREQRYIPRICAFAARTGTIEAQRRSLIDILVHVRGGFSRDAADARELPRTSLAGFYSILDASFHGSSKDAQQIRRIRSLSPAQLEALSFFINLLPDDFRVDETYRLLIGLFFLAVLKLRTSKDWNYKSDVVYAQISQNIYHALMRWDPFALPRQAIANGPSDTQGSVTRLERPLDVVTSIREELERISDIGSEIPLPTLVAWGLADWPAFRTPRSDFPPLEATPVQLAFPRIEDNAVILSRLIPLIPEWQEYDGQSAAWNRTLPIEPLSLASRISILEFYVQWPGPLPNDAYELAKEFVEGKEMDILDHFNRLLHALPSRNSSQLESEGNALHFILRVLGFIRPILETGDMRGPKISEHQLDMNDIVLRQVLLKGPSFDRLLNHFDFKDLSTMLFYLQRMPNHSRFTASYLANLLMSDKVARLEQEELEVLKTQIANVLADLCTADDTSSTKSEEESEERQDADSRRAQEFSSLERLGITGESFLLCVRSLTEKLPVPVDGDWALRLPPLPDSPQTASRTSFDSDDPHPEHEKNPEVQLPVGRERRSSTPSSIHINMGDEVALGDLDGHEPPIEEDPAGNALKLRL